MLKFAKQAVGNYFKPLWSLGIEYKLLVLGISLLPYDGVPILPFTYRPMAAIPICLSGIVSLFKYRDKYVDLLLRHRFLLGFSALSLAITMVQALLIDGEIGRFARFLCTGALGVGIFLTLFELLRSCYQRVGFKDLINSIFGIIAAAYVPALILGIIELCSIYGIIDPAINTSIMPIFGGWQPDRIYITSREASWASVHMLIAACSYLHCLVVSRKPTLLIPFAISIFLFLMTKSMQGVLILAVGMAMYIVWYCCTCGSWKRALSVVALSCAVAVLGYAGMYVVMSMQPGYYYAQRFLSINSLQSIVDLVYSDPSSFTRLVSPVIGVGMMLENLPFGIGGCMYATHYPDYIDAHFPWAIRHPEVASFYSGGTEASPFCLYTRLMGEFGIFGLLLVAFLMASVWKKLLRLAKTKGAATFCFFVLIMLAFPLQFDSYYNVPFLLAVAMVLSLELGDVNGSDVQRVSGRHFRA